MNATNSSQDRVGGEVGLLLSHLICINNNAPFSHGGWFFFFLLNLKHLARNWAIYTLQSRRVMKRKYSVLCISLSVLWSSPGHMLSSPLLVLIGRSPPAFGLLPAVHHLLPYASHHFLSPCLCSSHEWLVKHLCWSTTCTDKRRNSCLLQAHISTSLTESDLFLILESCSHL